MRKLLQLLSTKVDHTTVGICTHLRPYFESYNKASEWVWRNSLEWEHYSGEPGYPVPHPSLSAKSAEKINIPKWGTDLYGQRRRELCTFLLRKLDEKNN